MKEKLTLKKPNKETSLELLSQSNDQSEPNLIPNFLKNVIIKNKKNKLPLKPKINNQYGKNP